MAVSSTVAGLPSPPELVVELEESHARFLRDVVGSASEAVRGPIQRFRSGLPSPWLNGVVWAGDVVSADSLPGIAQEVVLAGGPASLWVPDRLVSGQTARELVSLGLVRAPAWSGLALDLRAADQLHDPPGAFLVQESHDLEADRLFTRTWNQAALEVPESAEAVLSEKVESARAHGVVRPLIAWSHAAPAAVSLLSRNGRSVALHGTATIPPVRRHGVAGALVLHALRTAHAEGAEYAITAAPPAATEMLRSLGFLVYTGWERFEWRPENAL